MIGFVLSTVAFSAYLALTKDKVHQNNAEDDSVEEHRLYVGGLYCLVLSAAAHLFTSGYMLWQRSLAQQTSMADEAGNVLLPGHDV